MKAIALILIWYASAFGAFAQSVPMQPLVIAWHGLADKATIGYHVYVGPQPGVYSMMFNCGPAEFVTINPLVPGFAIVKAYNTAGIEGPASNEIAFTPIPRPSPSPSPTVTPKPTPAGPLTINTGTPTPTPKTL